ncbi:NAD(P)H-hydrate dehydratase [candidate division KSB1 bacterium]|nr:NAD(P)H-hydrate dehydratase [candidate division KSB1 bacterium]MBL7093052.1 NAD(P)H-hydrate dehydratase [candidate division KSB1 bacterium]
MKVSTVEQMRNLDKTATEKYGIPDELLMENAGLATYSMILNEFGIEGKKFFIICGLGNNGGDGFVVARKILSMGGESKVVILGDPQKYKGAAKKNYDMAETLKINIQQFETIEKLKSEIATSDAIIDAIFGTGLVRDVEGKFKDIVEAINNSGKIVFAVDIPSGINGNTGKIMGVAVEADYTCTFGLTKVGNLLYPGFENGGKLYVTYISFPPELYSNDSLKIEVNVPTPLPQRNIAGHKGSFGDVLFIAGAANYFGAPYFAALSFLKAGGGYSRLAAPKSVTPFIANKGSEIVFAPQDETSTGSISLKSKDELLMLSEKVDMVVIGPGLSLNEETQKLVQELTAKIDKPVLIDGDGITAISENIEILKERKEPTILTPHLGEMARFTGKSIKEVDDNKVKILQETATELNAIIVLKGAHSMIGFPDGKVFVNLSGNSGMASAGSGDVLTGTIAAMFGLGMDLNEAVRTGVFMHGFSGDLVAEVKGEDGMTAQDILNYLPHAVKTYREEYDSIVADCYGCIYIL